MQKVENKLIYERSINLRPVIFVTISNVLVSFFKNDIGKLVLLRINVHQLLLTKKCGVIVNFSLLIIELMVRSSLMKIKYILRLVVYRLVRAIGTKRLLITVG